MRPLERPTLLIRLPLIVLAVLSIVGDVVDVPAELGGFRPFSGFLATIFGGGGWPAPPIVEVVTPVVSLLGVYLAYLLFLRHPALTTQLSATPVGAAIRDLWLGGWGFDRAYDTLLVRPYAWVARVNRDDAPSIPLSPAQPGLGCLF